MLLVHQQENQNQIESNAYIELKETRNKKTYSNEMKSCSNFDNIKLFVTISKAFINLTMKASVQLYCGWLRGEASTSNNAIAEKQLRMLCWMLTLNCESVLSGEPNHSAINFYLLLSMSLIVVDDSQNMVDGEFFIFFLFSFSNAFLIKGNQIVQIEYDI